MTDSPEHEGLLRHLRSDLRLLAHILLVPVLIALRGLYAAAGHAIDELNKV